MKAKAEQDEYKVSATFTLHTKPANALWQWTQVPQVEVTAYAMLPSTSVIKFTLGALPPPCVAERAARLTWGRAWN